MPYEPARYILLPFPAEHEDAVVGFVLGFTAHSATMAYYGWGNRLSDWVAFRARLRAMIDKLLVRDRERNQGKA